jgi:predicted ferric reductase
MAGAGATTLHHPAAPAPSGLTRRGAATLSGVVTALAAVAVLVVWWADPATRKGGGDGATLTEIGRATGLLAAVLLLATVTLMARVPWLERRVGTDWLVRGHRWLGAYAGWLLVVHPVAMVLGYARNVHARPLHETRVVLDYSDVLIGTVGLALLALVLTLSARPVRRRLPYEVWHLLHLLAYAGIGLAFAHQVVNGAQFFHRPYARLAWIALHLAVVYLVVEHRVVEPVRRLARHRFRVCDVVDEPDGSVSVYVTGRHLHELRAEPGQYFRWRFLTRDAWWQAHPFSLSQAPNGKWLRMTAKPVGDHSRWLTGLRADGGVSVLLEGPYGALTPALRRGQRLVLIGAGSGIAPMLALAQHAARARVATTLVYRVSHEHQVNFREELAYLEESSYVRVRVVTGPRGKHGRRDPLDRTELADLVRRRPVPDVYLCGPPGLTDRLSETIRDLGVPAGRIHSESFDL